MRSPPKKKFKMAALDKWDPRLELDVVVFNAVLNACVQRKQWVGAFWVMQQLKLQGIQPSTATYGLIMEGFGNIKDFCRVLETVLEMKTLCCTWKIIANNIMQQQVGSNTSFGSFVIKDNMNL